jgi:thiol-disulfide isomerase/thioredoxin
MRSFKSVILSCLLTLTVLGRDCLADFYENDAHVKVIDKYSTFENEILKGESVWMIQFFSPTCPDSKKAVQQYSRVAEVTRGIFNLAAVDMSTEAGKRIGATLKVDSYPTFYIYGDDKNNPRPYTGPVGPQEILQGLVEFVVYTLQMRADPNAKEDPNVNKDKNYDGTVASKIKNLSMSNFQVMVLDNPEVSAVACEWIYYGMAGQGMAQDVE